jgi:hypothetical protein
MARKKSQVSRPYFPEWAVLLFCVIWALFLSFEYWGFGETSYVKIFDNANANLAARVALGVDAQQNESGNWYADLWAGTDKNAQSGMMGVLDLLFYVMPGWLAYGSLMFLQRFVASYFTYNLLTKHLNVNPWLAIFPALFYSLWSQNQLGNRGDGFVLYDALGLPAIAMILFLVGELANAGSAKRNLLLTFLLGFFFSSVSEYKFIIFLFPLLLLWLYFIYPRIKRVVLPFFVIFFLGWLSLEIIELSAAFSIAGISQRVLEPSACLHTDLFLQTMFRRVPRYLFNSFNFIGFGLGAAGLCFWKQRDAYLRNLKVFALLIVFTLGAVLVPLLVCSPLNPFGFFKGFDYTRFYLYIPFLISLLAGTGSHVLLTYVKSIKKAPDAVKNYSFPVIAIALCLVAVYQAYTVKVGTLASRASGSNYANVFRNPYLEYLKEYAQSSDAHYRALTIFREGSPIHPQPAYLWSYGLNTLDGYSGLYPLRFSEYWQAVIDPMMQVYPQCRTGLILKQGGSRVSLNAECDVGEIIEVANVTDLFNLDLLSLGGGRYFVSSVELSTPELVPIDTSGIKCPAEIPGCTPRFLYENPSAFPLIFAVDKVIPLGSNNRVLSRMKATDVDQLRSTAIVNINDIFDLPIEQLDSSQANIDIQYYSSDRIEVQVSSEEAKILVVTWNFLPAWNASIDGVDTQIFPTYHTFMGVFVPAGDHEIELRYEPIYTLPGLLNLITGK